MSRWRSCLWGPPGSPARGFTGSPDASRKARPDLCPRLLRPPERRPVSAPPSCKTEPSGGCAQTCDRVRESISGRQPRRIRQGAVEPRSPAFAAAVGPGAVLAAGSLRRTADGPPVPSSASRPRRRAAAASSGAGERLHAEYYAYDFFVAGRSR